MHSSPPFPCLQSVSAKQASRRNPVPYNGSLLGSRHQGRGPSATDLNCVCTFLAARKLWKMAWNDNRLDSKQAWHCAMRSPAEAFERVLWELVSDYGKCLICDRAFGSLASHISGVSHYKALGWKLNWSWPASSDNLIQWWTCKDGQSYRFDHLTGQHSSAAEQLAPQAASPSAHSPARDAAWPVKPPEAPAPPFRNPSSAYASAAPLSPFHPVRVVDEANTREMSCAAAVPGSPLPLPPVMGGPDKEQGSGVDV